MSSDHPLMTLRFSLPYPPSVNTYWRSTVVGGKFKKSRASVFLSDAGKRYRTAAILACNVARVPRGAVKGRLAVHITAYPPDRRERDLDNLPKGVLDALRHAGVIRDDADIDDLHIVRGQVVPQGRLDLVLSEIAHEPVQAELIGPESRTSEQFKRAFANEPEPRGLLARTGSVTIDKPPF